MPRSASALLYGSGDQCAWQSIATGFPTPPFPGFASHQSTPFSLVCAATPAGSAVSIAPPTPIFIKFRLPRAEPVAGASEFFIVHSPHKLSNLFDDYFLRAVHAHT